MWQIPARPASELVMPRGRISSASAHSAQLSISDTVEVVGFYYALTAGLSLRAVDYLYFIHLLL